MRLTLAIGLLAALLTVFGNASARGGHGNSSHSGPHASVHAAKQAGAGHRHSKANPGVKRDSHGKVARSEKAKDAFRSSHPCPSTGKTHGTCPGYVIDHEQPLKHGGVDEPGNMQWQTKAQAQIKDRRE